MLTQQELIRARAARQFFPAAAGQVALCGLVATILIVWNEPPQPSVQLKLPTAFQFGTFFLATGSWLLHRAVCLVRHERQPEFRRALIGALICAAAFVGVQTWGLREFLASASNVHETQTSVHGFVFLFAALHAMHFLVAQAVLLWVTLCAFADRYDHEYFWGVVFAAWCWHALGVVWLAILCVFAIVT